MSFLPAYSLRLLLEEPGNVKNERHMINDRSSADEGCVITAVLTGLTNGHISAARERLKLESNIRT